MYKISCREVNYMKKKKVVIIVIFILLIVVICSVIFFVKQNNTEKHIYYKDGTVRGFKHWENTRVIFPILNEIYGEIPYEDEKGNIYEYISNFDGIETCDATIKYELYDEDSLDEVYIYLKSTKYTCDELYEIMYNKMCKMYGDPIVKTDKYNNPTDDIHWSTDMSHIYIDRYKYSEDYQIKISFLLNTNTKKKS